MRHFLKFYCNPPSKHHEKHMPEPSPTAESAGQRMLGDTRCCAPNCKAVARPSNITTVPGAQTNDSPAGMPRKTGPAALRYSQRTLRSTRVNIPAHVGWEDVGRATGPTNITLLLQPCRRDLLTCPASKERMPCGSSATQCNKSARALPGGGWTYFYLSAVALPFQGCWNGQGCAACSLSCRPLSFYPE